MDNKQRLISTLLSAAIRGKQLQSINTENVDWKEIFVEAQDHKIAETLFPAIKNLDSCYQPEADIMERWTNYSFLSAIQQVNYMDNLSNILRLFNESNIPVISLKGIALRNLYPEPSFRSMSDADLLVHWDDFERSKTLLESLGYYTKVDTNAKEVRFIHKTDLMIEIHWLLIEPGYIENTETFETCIWNNKEQSLLNDVPINILSSEDQVIYLIMHMIMHIKYRGFGLRQLCDLVLHIEAKEKDIDWDSFVKRIEFFGIEKFTKSILLVCKTLFDLRIPINIPCDSNYNFIVESLINDIFASGVFGYKSSSRSVIRDTIERMGEEPEAFPSRSKLFINNVFPTGNLLSDRFNYAKKYPVLLPIAWIHRIVTNLFSKYFFSKFISRFSVPKETSEIYTERNKLLKDLDLR